MQIYYFSGLNITGNRVVFVLYKSEQAYERARACDSHAPQLVYYLYRACNAICFSHSAVSRIWNILYIKLKAHAHTHARSECTHDSKRANLSEWDCAMCAVPSNENFAMRKQKEMHKRFQYLYVNTRYLNEKRCHCAHTIYWDVIYWRGLEYGLRLYMDPIGGAISGEQIFF